MNTSMDTSCTNYAPTDRVFTCPLYPHFHSIKNNNLTVALPVVETTSPLTSDLTARPPAPSKLGLPSVTGPPTLLSSQVAHAKSTGPAPALTGSCTTALTGSPSKVETVQDLAATQEKVDGPRSPSASPLLPFNSPPARPFTAAWVLARIHDSPDRSIPLLRNWSHRRRFREVTPETVAEIRALAPAVALDALRELQEPRAFVRGTRGRKLSLRATVSTLDTLKDFSSELLIDSGCEGSCIDSRFVQEHGLNTTKLPRAIRVFNADGQENLDGPISEMVSLKVTLGNHTERLDLGVTNLGRGQIFLGHDWLRLHNPSIDWYNGTVSFDRCPPLCRPRINANSMDLDEDARNDDTTSPIIIEDGDKLLMVDASPAINVRATTNISMELAIQAEKEKPVRTFEEMVPPYLHSYRDVFEKTEFDQFPPSRPWDHAIELLPGAEPKLSCKVYPLSRDEQAQLDEFLEENLRTGRIRPSKSPMASPFFFVKKKDGKLRPVQDYRKLNEITVKNRYPLPLISELLDKLSSAKYFTKLDVRWGYNNIRIKKGDEHKAAFLTNRGLYEPLVMFFGLTNSPATFQTMMNDIFQIEIRDGYVIVYLDDILIFSADLDTHHCQVKRVLEILRKNRLFLKPEKCSFDTLETEYLGMIIREGQVQMDPIKVSAIKEWPIPLTKRDVQSFLGFCNFYRKFIKNYSKVAHPLHSLTGNTPFTWTEEQQQSFNMLRNTISTAPVLVMPNDNDLFRVEADASGYAVGAALLQKQEGVWRTIGFMSRALTPTQRNYEIYDRELLAIVLALEEFRPHLITSKLPFEVWTDHANLQYFREPQKVNRRQARWSTQLQDYHFTLHHIPGSANSRADLLSRRPGFDQGEDDNVDVVLLPDTLFTVNTLSTQETEHPLLVPGAHLLTSIPFESRVIRVRNNLDPSVVDALARKEKGWKKLPNGLITHHDRLYIPHDETLRTDIIAAHHDPPIAGHPGQSKTLELVLRDYWWPRLTHDVKRYVEGCETCQRTKPRRTPHATPLHPFTPPSRPWEVISMDIIGPLPESQGSNAILVVVDLMTKAVKFEATNMELTSEGTARILRDRVFRDHGLPRRIVHDRDPRFVSKYLRSLLILLGVQQNPSTAYHPQTDGQTERMNQEVEQFLRVFVNHQQDDWKDWLAIAEFTHNNSVHSATGTTPFMLNVGQHPWTGQDTRREVRNESALEFAGRMKRIRENAQASMRQAAERMKRNFDRHARPAHTYEEGNLVYLEATNLKTDRPTRKLDDKRFGPFKIVKKVGAAAYKLHLPDNWPAIHPVFHESLLTPYRPPRHARQHPPHPPNPVVIDNSEEYEVEAILNSRRRRGQLQYLVHWTGYPREEETWEPQENITHADDLIEEFHRNYPTKPSLSNTVRAVMTLQETDNRLYLPDTRTQGLDYVRPPPQPRADVILPLSTLELDRLIYDRFLSPTTLSCIPETVHRLWVYETDTREINTVVYLQDCNATTSRLSLYPMRLYAMLDPLPLSRLHGFYDCPTPTSLCLAPLWLPRDYYRSNKLVWSLPAVGTTALTGG
jgi:RNase H-like domain found in reverse transcriptase/Reverse transcriptase (RNA-dependent DNA polymerase)/Integrase zinc binding domain/Chromo (CHRromatin Organisation MOdifier) domain